MKFSEFVAAVAGKAGVDKAMAEKILKSAVEVKTDVLKAKDSLSVPGLGTFQTRDNPARTGRNPQTGESMEIAAKTVVKFKPAKGLADSVNG